MSKAVGSIPPAIASSCFDCLLESGFSIIGPPALSHKVDLGSISTQTTIVLFNVHHVNGNSASSFSVPLHHSVPSNTQPPYEIENQMDYTTVPELQPNPTPASLSSYPPSIAAYFPASYPPHYQLYLQNPNPSSADPQSSIGTQEFHGVTGAEPGVNPPGVASYVPLTSDSVSHLTHEAHADYSYAHNPIADSSSGYYFDPNAQNWAAREAVRQFGVDPVGYGAAIPVASTGSEQLATANTNSTWWPNTTTQPHGNGTWKNRLKKLKTKVVQSAYCEVCKIDCTSKDVLDQHKLGKKHKKNLEKLKEALRPPPPPQVPVPPAASSNPVIGPQPERDKSKSGGGSKKKRKAIETPADLEKKKKKVLEGGAAAEAVKICTICNVVCNSETVFNYHLAGQKHAAMMKKQAS